MTLRMNYLITTMPRTLFEVQSAIYDWESAHSKENDYTYAQRSRVGHAIAAPIVKDSAGEAWTCELFETHYNVQQDTLIFVWRPQFLVKDLPDTMRKVPDVDSNNPIKYGGE